MARHMLLSEMILAFDSHNILFWSIPVCSHTENSRGEVECKFCC